MPRKSNTRAAAGAGSIRQRPDGTWEARYIVGHDPGTGKPIRRSVYAQTQREVRQRLAQAIAAIDNSDYFEPSKMPLAQWLDIWAGEYMGDKRYSTKKTYKANIENHLKPALGAVKLSQLMPHTIQKFYNGLLANGQKVPKRNKAGKIVKKDGAVQYETAPMSAKTVRNIHGTLTKALSTAVSIGYLRTNPADRVTLPRIEKKELAPLTDAQVKDFLQASTGDSLEIIMKVILFTGMRESEEFQDSLSIPPWGSCLQVCGNRRRLASHGTALTLMPEPSKSASSFKSASWRTAGPRWPPQKMGKPAR